MRHTDLKIGNEVYKGNNMAANRLLRRSDNIIEVQHVYRYGKPSETMLMTLVEFDTWRVSIERV